MVYYKEGVQFFSAVINPGKKKIFTPILIYNIACMSIEKLFMAFFFYNNTLPENHTMKDLIDSALKIRDMDRNLVENMMFLDGFQNICPVYYGSIKALSGGDIKRTIETLLMVRAFVDAELKITPGKKGAAVWEK